MLYYTTRFEFGSSQTLHSFLYKIRHLPLQSLAHIRLVASRPFTQAKGFFESSFCMLADAKNMKHFRFDGIFSEGGRLPFRILAKRVYEVVREFLQSLRRRFEKDVLRARVPGSSVVTAGHLTEQERGAALMNIMEVFVLDANEVDKATQVSNKSQGARLAQFTQNMLQMIRDE